LLALSLKIQSQLNCGNVLLLLLLLFLLSFEPPDESATSIGLARNRDQSEREGWVE
jgi:hypothetical protein